MSLVRDQNPTLAGNITAREVRAQSTASCRAEHSELETSPTLSEIRRQNRVG